MITDDTRRWVSTRIAEAEELESSYRAKGDTRQADFWRRAAETLRIGMARLERIQTQIYSGKYMQ